MKWFIAGIPHMSPHCAATHPEHHAYLHKRFELFHQRLTSSSSRGYPCVPSAWLVKLSLQVADGGIVITEARQHEALSNGHRLHARNVAALFRGVIERNTAHLLPLLPQRDPMDIYLSFNDWTQTHNLRLQAMLPLGEGTSVKSAIGGIPVPDMSFHEYEFISQQNARSVGALNSSWGEMWRGLQVLGLTSPMPTPTPTNTHPTPTHITAPTPTPTPTPAPAPARSYPTPTRTSASTPSSLPRSGSPFLSWRARRWRIGPPWCGGAAAKRILSSGPTRRSTYAYAARGLWGYSSRAATK